MEYQQTLPLPEGYINLADIDGWTVSHPEALRRLRERAPEGARYVWAGDDGAWFEVEPPPLEGSMVKKLPFGIALAPNGAFQRPDTCTAGGWAPGLRALEAYGGPFHRPEEQRIARALKWVAERRLDAARDVASILQARSPERRDSIASRPWGRPADDSPYGSRHESDADYRARVQAWLDGDDPERDAAVKRRIERLSQTLRDAGFHRGESHG
jgi:hypothetical protein